MNRKINSCASRLGFGKSSCKYESKNQTVDASSNLQSNKEFVEFLSLLQVREILSLIVNKIIRQANACAYAPGRELQMRFFSGDCITSYPCPLRVDFCEGLRLFFFRFRSSYRKTNRLSFRSGHEK